MIKFSGYILLIDLISIVLIGLPAYMFAVTEFFVPVLIAFAITTVLAIASFYPFTRMSTGSINKYMTAMLIGMMLRMIFIGASVAVVFLFTELHQIGFTVALLFSYICKSAVETYILTRKHRGQPSVS